MRGCNGHCEDGIGIVAADPAAAGTAKFGGVDRGYGGRARIPWSEWDRAVEEWKAARRAEFERKKLLGRMQFTALQQNALVKERRGFAM